MKLILVNGPPSSGKDTVCKEIYEKIGHRVGFERYSAPLKTAFAAITGTNCNNYFENSVYEPIKDEVIPWLGVSYRQWQIDFSEKFMKPLYGSDIFGKLFEERLLGLRDYDLVVVPDSGFDIEVQVIESSKLVPLEDIILIRMHREGYTFAGDSRNYVYPDKIRSFDYFNKDLEDTEKFAVDLSRALLSNGRIPLEPLFNTISR